MSATVSGQKVPKLALLGAAALLGLSLLAATGSRLTGVGATRLAPAEAVDSRALRFADRGDGAVVVEDAGSGRAVAVLAPGSNGFVRGVMRGLARERRRAGVGAETPFVLTRWADGRLSLEDPATGRRIALEPFGPANAAAFARMLEPAQGGR